MPHDTNATGPTLAIPPLLSGQSRAILAMIAAGHTYEQILHAHPDLDYFDIFDAAGEALRVTTESPCATAGQPPKAYAVKDIQKRHPRAYEPWTPEEETQLRELLASGLTVAQIAGQLARQRGAIRSRIARLRLFESLSTKEQLRFDNAKQRDEPEPDDIDE